MLPATRMKSAPRPSSTDPAEIDRRGCGCAAAGGCGGACTVGLDGGSSVRRHACALQALGSFHPLVGDDERLPRLLDLVRRQVEPAVRARGGLLDRSPAARADAGVGESHDHMVRHSEGHERRDTLDVVGHREERERPQSSRAGNRGRRTWRGRGRGPPGRRPRRRLDAVRARRCRPRLASLRCAADRAPPRRPTRSAPSGVPARPSLRRAGPGAGRAGCGGRRARPCRSDSTLTTVPCSPTASARNTVKSPTPA